MFTLNIVASILENIEDQTNKEIDRIELIKKMPEFTHADIMTKIKYEFQSFARNPEANQKTGMKEQYLTDVRLMQKDSLMPKGIEKQSQEIDKVGLLADSILKPKKKGMNNTRSSFNRSNIHSVNGTNRNSKLSAFSRRKKQKQQDLNLISLGQPGEDPETANLWKLKDIQIDIRQKQQKAIEDKKKQFESKKQNFLKELSEKEYTFDFEGDAMASVQDQQKINYHSIKMKLSLMDRKLRSNIKFKDRENSTELKVNRKNSSMQQQTPSISVEFATIPLFQNQGEGDASALFGIPSDIEKYKLKDFKKHYGGRFTRLDKSLNSIDLTTQKNDEFNNLFSQRRHFKDQQRSINQSMVSYRTRIDHATRRKLALPKIHGKYSTLDRYQQY